MEIGQVEIGLRITNEVLVASGHQWVSPCVLDAKHSISSIEWKSINW